MVTNLNSRKLYLNCSVFLSSTGLQLTGKRFSGQLTWWIGILKKKVTLYGGLLLCFLTSSLSYNFLIGL